MSQVFLCYLDICGKAESFLTVNAKVNTGGNLLAVSPTTLPRVLSTKEEKRTEKEISIFDTASFLFTVFSYLLILKLTLILMTLFPL